MTEYIVSVITAGAVGTLLAMILPKESGSAGYVRYISQLVVLLVIIAPLGNISRFVSSINISPPVYEETAETDSGEKAVISKSAENISQYITEVCGSKFGFETESIRVRLVLDETDPENVIIEEIQIFTSEKSSEEKARAKKYFEEYLMTEVHIFGP